MPKPLPPKPPLEPAVPVPLIPNPPDVSNPVLKNNNYKQLFEDTFIEKRLA